MFRRNAGTALATCSTTVVGPPASASNQTVARSFCTRYGGVDEQLSELPSGTREAPASRGDGDLAAGASAATRPCLRCVSDGHPRDWNHRSTRRPLPELQWVAEHRRQAKCPVI